MKLAPLFLCACAAFAAEYMPLQSGNYWIYRDLSSAQTFTVRVGTPLSTQDGNLYHRLTGYVDRPLWVRALTDGTLVYLDEENSRELPLTSFEEASPGWAAAPFRPCEQESQRESKPQVYSGPLGRYEQAVRLNYRVFSCGDTGVLSEDFLPSVGMVRRTVITLLGPKALELVEARVQGLSFAGRPAASFDVSVNEDVPGKLLASLNLFVHSFEPVYLLYSDGQDYDLVLWNESGKEVYRWSDGRAFTQAVRSRTVVGGLRHNVELELRDALPDGQYLLEAWIKAGPAQRSFAAMTPLRIAGGRLVR
jgi:hypothetical protein